VQDGRVLGGVIAGLGRHLGIDPGPARLLFLLVLMLIPGSQFLIYPILWILMPEATEAPPAASDRMEDSLLSDIGPTQTVPVATRRAIGEPDLGRAARTR
jgi:phage shock protein PspC (stress-responsive transcriptional regulator)